MATLRERALQAAEKARAEQEAEEAKRFAEVLATSQRCLEITLRAHFGRDILVEPADPVADSNYPATALVDGIRFSMVDDGMTLMVELPCSCGRNRVWRSLPDSPDPLAVLGRALSKTPLTACRICLDEIQAAERQLDKALGGRRPFEEVL